jgi:hypothetical protein
MQQLIAIAQAHGIETTVATNSIGLPTSLALADNWTHSTSLVDASDWTTTELYNWLGY